MTRDHWTGDTAGFTKALDNLQSAYQDVLHAKIADVSTQEAELAATLRHAEKSATAMSAVIAKQISSRNAALNEESAKLEVALEGVESNLEAARDSILRIDRLLPPSERLLATRATNKQHYPLLHAYALELETKRLTEHAPGLITHSHGHAAPQTQLSRNEAQSG